MIKKSYLTFGIMTLFFLLFITLKANCQWQMANVQIKTRWASDVNPTNVWKEYPRPQMVRSDWENLNGLWQFEKMTSFSSEIPTTMTSKILVPFCVESALSGIKQKYKNFAYKRTFKIPDSWNGKRVLLHFEAVDWQMEAFVNGVSAGTHKGGYDPFTFDITNLLSSNGDQELVVKVYDPTSDGSQPRGKQTLNPGGIMYTGCSGIWQTVWLEAVPQTYIGDLAITPDVDTKTVNVGITTCGSIEKAQTINVDVIHNGSVVATSSALFSEKVSLKIPNMELWSPDHPFLYDLKVTLKNSDGSIDEVKSYFGMRKIEIKKDETGYYRTYLNNNFLFEAGPLDQGFWPDGIYTPPTDEAMANDILMMKHYGFNMVRKHIKVEPRRWYYYCDKLGLMVWQDFPSSNYCQSNPPAIDANEFKDELAAMVKTHVNTPCIITWVLFNEGGGQHDTESLVDYVRSLDNTRLINPASGWNHSSKGDFYDDHDYPMPKVVSTSDNQALAVGEYGGISYIMQNHLWNGNDVNYTSVKTPDELDNEYTTFSSRLAQLRENNGLSASVYTQLTDVENELNGLMSYDRIVKSDVSKIRKANELAINGIATKHDYLLSTADEQLQTWKYTISQPDDSWMNLDYDDSAWSNGKSGFGNGQPSNTVVGTKWTTNDIWIRKKVKFNITEADLDNLMMKLYHDEDCEIYINGTKVLLRTGYTTDYELDKFPSDYKSCLNLNDSNIVAVHCKQTYGGQYLDLGFYIDKGEQIGGAIKVNLNYSNSSELYVNIGCSNDTTATTPIKYTNFTKLHFADTSMNISDVALARSLTINPTNLLYDISKIVSDVDTTKAVKYFVKVSTDLSSTGSGTINNAEFIDYNIDKNGVTVPFKESNVEIKNAGADEVITVIINPDRKTAVRNSKIVNGILSWDTPQPNADEVVGYAIYKNGNKVETLSSNTFTYIIKNDEKAYYCVAAIFSDGTMIMGPKVESNSLNVAFNVNPDYLVLGETTYLNDSTTGNPENEKWMLTAGNNTSVVVGSSSSFKPTNAGIYDITLNAKNNTDENSLTKKRVLIVSSIASGNGLHFGGNSATVTCPSPIGLNSAFSIDWWMKPEKLNGATLFSSSDNLYKFSIGDDGNITAVLGPDKVISPSGFVKINEWHHYTLTCANKVITFYIDGKAVSTGASSLLYPAWNNFIIGNDSNLYVTIDELSFWRGALSSDTIVAHANLPINSNTNLKFYYEFNQINGDLKDSSSHAANGKLSGFTDENEAWIPTPGVFAVNIDSDEVIEKDVTSLYLTNYKKEFLHNNNSINTEIDNRFYGLLNGTNESTWTGCIYGDNNEDGVFVDNKYGCAFTAASSWHGFTPELSDKTVYETVSLPAGVYHFSVKSDSLLNVDNCYVVATLGDTLSSTRNLYNSSSDVLSNGDIMIDLSDAKTDTKISLGLLLNLPPYSFVSVASFNLYKKQFDIFQSDGKTTPTSISIHKVDNASNFNIIKGGVAFSDCMATIYNISGQLLFRRYCSGTNAISLPCGIYIVNGKKTVVQ
jgi:hypothetical protein